MKLFDKTWKLAVSGAVIGLLVMLLAIYGRKQALRLLILFSIPSQKQHRTATWVIFGGHVPIPHLTLKRLLDWRSLSMRR